METQENVLKPLVISDPMPDAQVSKMLKRGGINQYGLSMIMSKRGLFGKSLRKKAVF